MSPDFSDDIPNSYEDPDLTDWNNTVECDWDANGYRLPAEMEWMWAAMGAPADAQSGGTNETAYEKTFSGSDGTNKIRDYAVFGFYTTEEGRNTTSGSNSVGSRHANELGLYDMSGNVSEWCWDWYDAYPAEPGTDYRGPNEVPSDKYRVLRGGSWYDDDASLCAVAERYRYSPYNDQLSYIGFRVVRS
jgi:formylglycine-generating enzyme required for sulfatase activity